MVLSALQALYTERFSVSQAVSLSNSALNVLKLLLRSVCQTSRHPSGKVMGLSPYFGRLRGQQGLVGCNLLATQSLLFMQGLWAVKDTGICMYEVSSPFGFKYRYAEGCLCFFIFYFNLFSQVFNLQYIQPRFLWVITHILRHSPQSNSWLFIPLFCETTLQNSFFEI